MMSKKNLINKKSLIKIRSPPAPLSYSAAPMLDYNLLAEFLLPFFLSLLGLLLLLLLCYVIVIVICYVIVIVILIIIFL